MPNIFILNNRWDCSAQEPEMMDEVRKSTIIENFKKRVVDWRGRESERERAHFGYPK